MAVELIKKREQATGAFDFGRILENKPLGFPHEGGITKPFSNLFYWAHAWSDTGGLIGEHPHQGFEIMSYVLEGSISHYDNKMDTWKNLNKGDVQVIKSGNGITHAEKLLPGAHIFQIWFDPNLSQSLKKQASYTDFQSTSFPVVKEGNVERKIISGDGAPLSLDTIGIEMEELNINSGSHSIEGDAKYKYGIYVIGGEVSISSQSGTTDDYFLIEDASDINIEANEASRLFVMKVLKEAPYLTYIQSQN